VRRSTVNFVVDSISFVDLLVLVFTGAIMKCVLPPGTGGRGQELHGGQGGEHIKQLLGLGRHDWGDIHFWFAVGFIVLMVVHLVLHWGWIKSYIKSLIGGGGR